MPSVVVVFSFVFLFVGFSFGVWFSKYQAAIKRARGVPVPEYLPRARWYTMTTYFRKRFDDSLEILDCEIDQGISQYYKIQRQRQRDMETIRAIGDMFEERGIL